jgi:hypothetical protein
LCETRRNQLSCNSEHKEHARRELDLHDASEYSNNNVVLELA